MGIKFSHLDNGWSFSDCTSIKNRLKDFCLVFSLFVNRDVSEITFLGMLENIP